MKTNAIVRIILYILMLLLLVGILLAGIGFNLFAVNYRADSAVQDGPIVSDESVTMGAVNAQKIQNLEIDWAAGSITIRPSLETDTIRFWDDYSGDQKYQLHYSRYGDTLKIEFCRDDWEKLGFGIHFGTPLEKNLVIEVPESWLCDSLEINAAAAKLEVHDLTINQVEIDTASGAIGFENCNVMHLDVDTASGDVIYTGTLVTLDCDSASASIVANLQNVPQSMDLDTASGNLDISLPENAGFSVKLDAMSGKFKSDFDYEMANNRYICGNGGCTIDVSAMSGNVYIRKNPNTVSGDETEPNAPHHEHTDACTNEPASCPDYADHVHTDDCTSNPASCPDHAGHIHTDDCTSNPISCPDNQTGNTGSYPDNQSGEHHKDSHHN